MAIIPAIPLKKIVYRLEYQNETIEKESEERKAVLKLDLLLMPIMTMFYLLSFLVRSKVFV